MKGQKTQINYNYGIPIAIVIILCWLAVLFFALPYQLIAKNAFIILPLILLQTHLYTGLFITAHDAMHGTVSRNKKLNNFIGAFTALLVAYNWFPRLKKKHFLHHDEVATEQDPDYYNGNFFTWYFNFLKNYITWWQIVLMALTFNLLKFWFDDLNIALFWMIPAILSTLQLFYFGTYLPHKGEHDSTNIHKSSTQKKNHTWAFLSCYFFGYHYEHHDKPYVPWWQLYRFKS
ncbi:MAG: fatty acid desaturase [Sphingobacteriales bacterium]|nr:MAG: fatty acid desaturase [Sphingobacteriales bacterium]